MENKRWSVILILYLNLIHISLSLPVIQYSRSDSHSPKPGASNDSAIAAWDAAPQGPPPQPLPDLLPVSAVAMAPFHSASASTSALHNPVSISIPTSAYYSDVPNEVRAVRWHYCARETGVIAVCSIDQVKMISSRCLCFVADFAQCINVTKYTSDGRTFTALLFRSCAR